jgi:hypothetical protein
MIMPERSQFLRSFLSEGVPKILRLSSLVVFQGVLHFFLENFGDAKIKMMVMRVEKIDGYDCRLPHGIVSL